MLVSKFCDCCPLYRQQSIYRRAGLELDRAPLASWVGQSSQLLDPLVDALGRYVLSAKKLHADDTPIPVLEPGRGRTRTGRLWLMYETIDRLPDPIHRRSGITSHPIVKVSIRVITCARSRAFCRDAYAGFALLYASPRIIEAACWAHARRKFYDVYVIDRSAIAGEAIQRIGELYDIERQLRGHAPEVKYAARQEQAVPKLRALREWLEAISAQSPIAGAIHYTLARWAALSRFSDDGHIESDNNTAERTIRSLVLGRKTIYLPGLMPAVNALRTFTA